MKTSHTLLVALAAVLILAGSGSARAQDVEAYGDDYQSGDYGRVVHEENGLTILRADDRGAAEDGGINAPIFPGDAVRTGRTQRAEIQLAGGTLVRIDRDSDVTFLSLPSPYAEFRDNTVLQVAEGAIRIAARVERGEEFRIDTPAASVYLLGDGDFRVEADAAGRALVYSWRGVAEVSGEGGSVLVRAGMRSEVSAGSLPSEAVAFNTFVADPFDRWVARRDEVYRSRDRYRGGGEDYEGDVVVEGDVNVYEEIPYEVQPYYGELSRYGRWVYLSDYGWCWYPVRVTVDWRPYHYGYWKYGPRGYFWVSHEPWGWAPYRYGRWSYVSNYGWCWVPGRVFAGAWVSWSWGSAYIGWAPLDYWNRPAWYGRVHYGYYDPHCWSFISYTHVHLRDYHRHYVPFDRIGPEAHRHAVVTRAPRVAPNDLSSNPAARTRAYRVAREDEPARIGAIERGRDPGRRFVDLEERVAERTRQIRDSARGTPNDRFVPGIGRRDADAPGSRGARRIREHLGDRQEGIATRPGSPGGGGGPAPRPRRITADAPGAAGAPERAAPKFGSGTPRRQGGMSYIERRPADRDPGPANRDRQAREREPQRGSPDDQTDARRRELYRDVSRPREIRGRDPEARPDTPRANERREEQRREETDRGSDRRSPTRRPPSSARPGTPSRDRDDRDRAGTPPTNSPRRPAPSPRRITPDSSGSSGRPSTVTPRRTPTPRRSVAPQSSSGRGSRAGAAPQRPSRPTPRRVSPRPSTRDSRPRATTPSRPTPRRVSPRPSTRDSRPRATTPSRPAPRPSRPSVSPNRGSSSRPTPRAAPRGSSSGSRPTPRAAPRGGSSGSRPKASPSRPSSGRSSGGSKSKDKGSSRSGSRGKASRKD